MRFLSPFDHGLPHSKFFEIVTNSVPEPLEGVDSFDVLLDLNDSVLKESVSWIPAPILCALFYKSVPTFVQDRHVDMLILDKLVFYSMNWTSYRKAVTNRNLNPGFQHRYCVLESESRISAPILCALFYKSVLLFVQDRYVDPGQVRS